MNFTDHFEDYEFPKLGYIKLPKIKIPQSDIKELQLKSDCSSEDYLRALARRGFKEKVKLGLVSKDEYDIYAKRVKFEIEEIVKLLFTDYILLVYHILRFCKENSIPNSPARGSAGGSLLLYILDIIKINPIQHDLLFERFISSGRTEIKEFDGVKYLLSSNLCDIDIDSDRQLKYKVNEFIASIFPNRTAPIKTFNTLQGKSIIKEVLKVCEGFSEDQTKTVSDLIETRFGKVEEIHEALETNKKFQTWATNHMQTVEIAQKLNGLIKNGSKHASGIILCENELSETMPIELSSDKSIMCSYNMDDAQKLGCKIDNLGLKNLGIIKDCLDQIGKKMEDIDVNDPSIYQFLNASDNYKGIFQAEDGLGKNVMKQLQCQNIEDLGISIAIGRPGSMKFLDEIVQVRKNPELAKKIDDRIKDILAPTCNVIVFQEQIMALSRVMANFTPQEADGLRKGIGKKIKEKIQEYKPKFIERAIKNKYDEKLVNELWQTFEDSGDYLFNKSHSCGYSYLTAICAYLKVNHPKEFFLALIKNAQWEQEPLQEIGAIQKELRYFDIKLLSPHLLKSKADFTLEGKDIRFGLGAIKGISEKTMGKLTSFIKPHSNKFEMFESGQQAKISIGVVSALLQAGAMEGYANSRSQCVLEAQLWNLLTDKEKKYALILGESNNYDLISIVKQLRSVPNDKGKPIIKESRYQTIKKHYKPYLDIFNQNHKHEKLASWLYERALLGYSYSYTLKDIFSEAEPDFIDATQVQSLEEKEFCKMVGIVSDAQDRTSKNKNKYLKLKVEDETGFVDVMIFTDKLEKHKLDNNNKKAKKEDIVIIKGRKWGESISADSITVQNYKVYLKMSDLKEKETEEEKSVELAPKNS